MPVKKIESFNKHANPSTNTEQFNIEDYLNKNWNKIFDVVNNNADELIELQQDNNTNKGDISTIQQQQSTQDSNISSNTTEIEKLKVENEMLKSQIPTRTRSR